MATAIERNLEHDAAAVEAWAQLDASQSAPRSIVHLQLGDAEAWSLAQIVKRVGWSELRANAVDDDEAYAMRDALEQLRQALAEAGYAPR